LTALASARRYGRSTVTSADDKLAQIEAEVGKAALDNVRKQIDAQLERLAAATYDQAFIDHYLLIDFGFTQNSPYVPNSIQFYSSTGFLCYKTIDNASMQTLAPILACKYVHVMWDTATSESVHIYGFEPKT
jgi:hypothetical protein